MSLFQSSSYQLAPLSPFICSDLRIIWLHRYQLASTSPLLPGEFIWEEVIVEAQKAQPKHYKIYFSHLILSAKLQLRTEFGTGDSERGYQTCAFKKIVGRS